MACYNSNLLTNNLLTLVECNDVEDARKAEKTTPPKVAATKIVERREECKISPDEWEEIQKQLESMTLQKNAKKHNAFFISPQERQRRRRARIARKRCLKMAMNQFGVVQGRRQLHRDNKVLAANSCLDSLKGFFKAVSVLPAMFKSVNHVNNQIEQISESIKENISNAYNNLILSMLHIFNSKSKLLFICVELIRFIANVLPDVANSAKSSLLSLARSFLGAHPQVRDVSSEDVKPRTFLFSSGPGSATAESAACIFAGLVGDAVTFRKIDGKIIKEFCLTFNALCQSTKHVYTFVHTFLSRYYFSIIKKLTAYFCLGETQTGLFPKIRDESVELTTYCDYVTEVDSVVNAQVEEYTDPKYLLRAHDLMQYTTFIKKAFMEKTIELHPLQKQMVVKAIDDVTRWRTVNFHSLRMKREHEVAPFHLSFAGEAEQGKSYLTKFFSSAVTQAAETKWIFHNPDVYEKGHAPHWDRYKGQEIVIRDDLCQARQDNNLDVDDRKFLIDVMTPTNLQVPMAELSDKGMISAVKLLVSSTNVAYMTAKPVFQSENALNRRRDLLYYVILDRSGPFKEAVKAVGLDENYGNYKFVKLPRLSDDLKIKDVTFMTKVNDGTIPTLNIIDVCKEFTTALNEHYTNALNKKLLNVKNDVLDRLFIKRTDGLTDVPLFDAACLECEEANENEDPNAMVPGHEFHGLNNYNLVSTFSYQGRPHTSVLLENIPNDIYLESSDAIGVPQHCLACGHRRFAVEDSGMPGVYYLAVNEVENEWCYPWRDIFECDCSITWSEFGREHTEFRVVPLYPDDLEVGFTVVPPVGRDEDNLVRAANEPTFMDDALGSSPQWTMKGIWNSVVEMYKTTFGFTAEMIEKLKEVMPTWAWTVVLALSVLAGMGFAVSMFKNMNSGPEKVSVDMTEQERELFESALLDKEEAECTLQYVIQQAKREGWNADKTRQMYYQASKSYDDSVRTQARRFAPSLPRTYVSKVIAAHLSSQGVEQVMPKLMKNAANVTVYCEDGKVRSQKCFFTHGRQFIVNAHTWSLVTPDSRVVIYRPNGAGDVGKYEFKGSHFDQKFALSEDLAFVLCKTRAMPEVSDVRGHFGQIEDMVDDDFYSHLLWNEKFERFVSTNAGYTSDTRMQTEKGEVYIPVSLHVGVVGKMGDCGSLLIKNDKIIGMMNGISTGDRSSFCSFVPLTGDIPDMVKAKEFKDEREQNVDNVTVSANFGSVFPRGTTEHVGIATADYTNKISDRSKQLPTVLNHPPSKPNFCLYPLTKFQPVMTIHDKRISEEVRQAGDPPMQIGIDKFKEPMMPPKSGVLARSVLVVTAMLQLMKPSVLGKRLLNMDEIINGVIQQGERVVEGMNMATSMGVPFRNYVQRFGKAATGKLDYFSEILDSGDDVKRYEVDSGPLGKILMEDYNRIKQDLVDGRVPFWLVAENLKDETLKWSKITAAKTRVFETLPCSATMVFREYFGAWTDAVRKNCVEFPISVGIAAQKRDWTTAAIRMKKLGNRIIAGDYANWDGKTPADVMMAACDVINKWYDDEFSKHRELLIYALVHQYMVAGKSVMLRHGGMSSGSPITSEFNSLVNWLLLLCSFQDIAEEAQVEMTSEDLKEQFELMLYGDDHVVSVGSKFDGVVTFSKVRDWMTAHGIGYTDSGKTTNVFEYETLEEITFLKRKFVNEFGRYKAPLDINSIRMSVMWWMKRKGTDRLKILEDKRNSFVSEMFMHGEQVFNQEVARFNGALADLKDGLHVDVRALPIILSTYSELQDKWLAET